MRLLVRDFPISIINKQFAGMKPTWNKVEDTPGNVATDQSNGYVCWVGSREENMNVREVDGGVADQCR